MVTDTWPPPKKYWKTHPLSESEKAELVDLREIILNLRGSPNTKFNICVQESEGRWFEDRYAHLMQKKM